jgi:TolB-like protein
LRRIHPVLRQLGCGRGDTAKLDDLSLEVGQPAQAKTAPAPAPEKSAPPRLSMVVLPFANIGGNPEQEHFVDGVTESLTTDLSRIRGAVVIARNTAFTYSEGPDWLGP